jgi:hypothetical protein
LATGEHHEIDGAEEVEINEPVEDPYDPYAKYYGEDEDEDEESEAR